MRNFCKNIDIWLSYCEIYILDHWPHLGGGGGEWYIFNHGYAYLQALGKHGL